MGAPVLWTICNGIVSALNFGASLICLFFFYCIMSEPKMRTNAFNLYVGFMIFPDALYAMSNGFLYLSKALDVPIFPRYEVIVYLYFVSFVVNFYANGVVTHEINKLITQSNNRQRTQPPDVSRVYKQMAAVYFYGCFLGTWAVLPVSWSLFHITDNAKGEGDLGSPPGGLLSRTSAIAIAYGTVLIPAGYVVYVSIRVWRKKLLPRKGKTRTLSLFFMRVIIVFVLFYFPNTATTVIQSKLETETGIFWIRIVRGLLACGQVYTTLYLIAHKDDIRQAIISTYNKTFGKVCCKIKQSESRRSNLKRGRSGSVRVSGISMAQSQMLRQNSIVSSYQSNEASTTGSGNKMDDPDDDCVMQSEWEAEDEYENDATGKNTPAERDEEGVNDPEAADEENGESRFNSVDMAGQVTTGSTS